MEDTLWVCTTLMTDSIQLGAKTEKKEKKYE